MQNKYFIVLNTCPDSASAESIATTLVRNRLAACINIIPNIRSIYEWKGELNKGTEYLLIIKTLAECYKELEKTIQSLHPYELPEIIAVSIEAGLPDYLTWISEIRNE
ncbi:MAG TPA: divalent-cation tolerance protein CutA [Gammaproteobacteria bacterium]